jgi:hypothetical protein
MTFRLSMISAALLFSAQVALASPLPTSTDEARAMAGRAPPQSAGSSSIDAARAPRSTDEARALAGRALPFEPSRSVLAFAGAPGSSDEARALAGGAVRAVAPAGEHRATVACQQSCACKHG